MKLDLRFGLLELIFDSLSGSNELNDLVKLFNKKTRFSLSIVAPTNPQDQVSMMNEPPVAIVPEPFKVVLERFHEFMVGVQDTTETF